MDATRAQYVEGVADPESLNPDLWTLDQHFLDLPGRDQVMLDLFYDYTSKSLCTDVADYLRKRQPATLITWGANDRYFVADGARAYLADVPNAELHLLDTGHFALATHAEEIADLIAAFHARQRLETQRRPARAAEPGRAAPARARSSTYMGTFASRVALSRQRRTASLVELLTSVSLEPPMASICEL